LPPRAIYETASADIRASIAGLGVEGLHWQPDAAETNSAAVLAAHA
jgi:hypothetical protein